jgi:hypothetical protein
MFSLSLPGTTQAKQLLEKGKAESVLGISPHISTAEE